jgi:hypothetical protein
MDHGGAGSGGPAEVRVPVDEHGTARAPGTGEERRTTVTGDPAGSAVTGYSAGASHSTGSGDSAGASHSTGSGDSAGASHSTGSGDSAGASHSTGRAVTAGASHSAVTGHSAGGKDAAGVGHSAGVGDAAGPGRADGVREHRPVRGVTASARRARGIFPPREQLSLRGALALSGWAALAATALPGGWPLRWIPVLLFVGLGPGLALLLPQPPARELRPAARLEVLALAAPLSLSLATLDATALFLVSGFSAPLFLASLATVTTLASLLPALPLPAARRGAAERVKPVPDPEAPR